MLFPYTRESAKSTDLALEADFFGNGVLWGKSGWNVFIVAELRLRFQAETGALGTFVIVYAACAW